MVIRTINTLIRFMFGMESRQKVEKSTMGPRILRSVYPLGYIGIIKPTIEGIQHLT
jgi:hypothetical protein